MLPELERLREQIERAIKQGHGLTFDAIAKEVDAGRMQVWSGRPLDSIMVTELVDYPNGSRGVHFILAAGDMTELQVLYPIVEAWAKKCGCTYASMTGREGWTRSWLTREAGWRPGLRLYEKDLRA